MATRLVQIKDPGLDIEPSQCFVENGFDATLVQGFFIDPEWFFATVPVDEARSLLSESERFLLPHDSAVELGAEVEVAGFDLVSNYGIEVEHPGDEEMGHMRIAVDRSRIQASFERTMTRFVGLAAMMIVSLAMGMWLLVRSVQQSSAAARRTENFVAAVSHELRTPIAAVKMYGEMLHEGWIRDPEKQSDYLARILREADRLDSLVDRVLQKRSLAARPARPVAGDLGAIVSEKAADLLALDPHGVQDVVLDVQESLPPVLLVPEAVHGILTNLVDNARKYATGDMAVGPKEPISVCVREHKGRVVLEVLDRGPGITEGERSRVFQAFYRVGDERTRRRPGTGLGLHLVWLQSNLMGARVQALPRPGGGALFRVTFRSARGSRLPLPAPKSHPSTS
jgi:signal transduction histidine kinase